MRRVELLECSLPRAEPRTLWAKQMERQVNALMERCAQVLGPDFAVQLEGRRLRKSGHELLAKLDASAFFLTFDVKLDTSTAIAKNVVFVGMLHANCPTGLVDCQNLSPSSKNESSSF